MFQPSPDTTKSRRSVLKFPRSTQHGRAPAPPLERWLDALKRPAVFAHRGASIDAPENSLLSLRLASEQGADGVEFDVRACGSGEPVVFHDRTLARCTGVLGEVAQTPLEELRKLRLHRLDRSRGSTESIPTLDEWLEAAPRSLFLNLEVKAPTAAASALAAECARTLDRHRRGDFAVLSAFHPAALAHAALAAPSIPRALLLSGSTRWRWISLAGAVTRPQAVHVDHRLVTPERVRRWHAMKLKVMTWTVDGKDEAKRCLDAGVDGLITNVPALMRPLVERYHR